MFRLLFSQSSSGVYNLKLRHRFKKQNGIVGDVDLPTLYHVLLINVSNVGKYSPGVLGSMYKLLG
jgi:hypothetical protein